jgi:hypothetical protein
MGTALLRFIAATVSAFVRSHEDDPSVFWHVLLKLSAEYD